MSLSKYDAAYKLILETEQLREKFDVEQRSLLSVMRDKEISKAGWSRYRDCQAMFRTSDLYLREAHNEALKAVKRPTDASIRKIRHNLEMFDESWQNARQYSLIGALS
jgi:hypothetical protein|tara:strand:- start:41 stop:364 length:324 start_codon:yes stop_codon:yes gene_type:complete